MVDFGLHVQKELIFTEYPRKSTLCPAEKKRRPERAPFLHIAVSELEIVVGGRGVDKGVA